MNQTVYDENLQAEIDRVKKIILGDPNDPTSYNYKRKFVRPEIHWWRAVLWCVLVLGGIAVLAVVLRLFSVSGWITHWTGVAILGGVILICLKRILIFVVQVYQRYAPVSLRDKCRFEPSCSEYMVLSLQKYGAIKGLVKGIRRMKRCNIRNGGFDYP